MRLVEKGSFDAIRDIAEVFPLSVFPDALGIDSEGRENFLTYGAMVFAGMGPENDYFRNLMAHAPKVLPWVTAKCQREALAPGSFGAQVYEAADTGEITQEEAPLLVRSFLSAGLDTTISAIGMALYSLARHAINGRSWPPTRRCPAPPSTRPCATIRRRLTSSAPPRTKPRSAAFGSPGMRRSCCCSLPPTATRAAGSGPTSSTSPGASPAISGSAPASTVASARWWRGWKARPCCRRWLTAWRRSRSRASRSIATAPACVHSAPCPCASSGSK